MPALLTPEEMDGISAGLVEAGFYPDTCAIYRAPAVMEGGYPSDDDYALTVSVPCRVDPATNPERPIPGIPAGTAADHLIACQRGTDVRQTDRIEVTGEATGTFDVTGIAHPSFSLETVCACEWVAVDA